MPKNDLLLFIFILTIIIVTIINIIFILCISCPCDQVWLGDAVRHETNAIQYGSTSPFPIYHRSQNYLPQMNKIKKNERKKEKNTPETYHRIGR